MYTLLEDRELTEDEKFELLTCCDRGGEEWTRIRAELIESFIPLVRFVANRFAGRGEGMDELVQVGNVGLIKAVDRFDPSLGNAFATFAVPTIAGELKRHFRDRTWAVRPPRRLQELRGELRIARAELAQRLGRSPKVAELAEEMGCSAEEVLETIAADEAHDTYSLDRPLDDNEDSSLLDTLGQEDRELDLVEFRESLKPAMRHLPVRERRILLLRFYGNKTQQEIAEEMGVSQMHVSRLLSQTLRRLRSELTRA
ncbi:SigB/SigF/SigG family RNA polymerase sigma factor [Rhizohabitans arisaemae]|uniref:SigB/SigF/SigG family RNA polymerase sigma factor n=1 Tax=Rhizohabitans arisaemae TaxID=2720610 RepID=UPI0024B0615D|nr:SigB/SigF/SigG family RNA polymerase sigma factor [Rhizohabitans arisaemae]